MAELKRVSPEQAKIQGVELKIPDGASVGIGVAQTVMRALGTKGEERNRIMHDLYSLAGAVDNFGGTIAEIEGARAQKAITLATNMDFQAYTVALGEAHRLAFEDYRATTHGTLAEAQEHYRACLQQRVADVDRIFFPENEEDRVGTNYFRYQKLLGLSAEHPMMQAAKVEAARKGAEQMITSWVQERDATNEAKFMGTQNLNIAAGNIDPKFWESLAMQYPEHWDSEEAKQLWVNDCINQAMRVPISRQFDELADTLPNSMQKDFDAAIATKGLDEALAEVKKNAESKIDAIVSNKWCQQFLQNDRDAMRKDSNKKWLDDQRTRVEAQAAAFFKQFTEDLRTDRLQKIKAAKTDPAAGKKLIKQDAELVAAANRQNNRATHIEEYNSRFGNDAAGRAAKISLKDDEEGLVRETLEKIGGIQVSFGGEDITEQLAMRFVASFDTNNLETDDEVDQATRYLNFAAEYFEPRLHERVVNAYNRRVDVLTSGKKEAVLKEDDLNAAIRLYIATVTDSKVKSSANDYNAEDLKRYLYIKAAVQGCPTSELQTRMSDANAAYMSGVDFRADLRDMLNDAIFDLALDSKTQKKREKEEIKRDKEEVKHQQALQRAIEKQKKKQEKEKKEKASPPTKSVEVNHSEDYKYPPQHGVDAKAEEDKKKGYPTPSVPA